MRKGERWVGFIEYLAITSLLLPVWLTLMAAYASLVSLIRTLEQIHGDPTHILHLHRRDFNPLLETVLELQTTMEKIHQTPPEFEERIAYSFNRADDLIDSYVSYLTRSQERGGRDDEEEEDSEVASLLRVMDTDDDFLALFNRRPPFFSLHDDEDSDLFCNDLKILLLEVQKLSDEAASILVESKSLQVHVGVVAATANMQINQPVSRRDGKVSVVPIGFDADLKILRDMLYGDSSQREVIPIVGMPGSGKTTLATALYDDDVNVRRFDRIVWVTVSHNYNIFQVLLQLLRDLNGSPPEIHGNDEVTKCRNLRTQVSQTLKNRRYLIVMDDVWSQDFWDQVNSCLPDDKNRSRILLTARLEDVASYATGYSKSCYIYKVELMDWDRSWNLLKNKVFGEKDCPIELEEIGKAIAQKCRGLPLSIVVIAGILSSVDPKKDSWEKIAGDVNAAIRRSDKNDPVMEILSLSYKHLPQSLKPCFLYLASFPEDYEISVSRLMMLWVAEGFLKKPIKPERLEEEVAYECLEHLVKKNLILVSQVMYNGRIVGCYVHDLVRDLCVETGQLERFVYQMDNKQYSARGAFYTLGRHMLNSRLTS